jgi:hypothetical protein
MACDYCKKVTKRFKPMPNGWETKNIKSVCDSCYKKIQDKSHFLSVLVSNKRLRTWLERTRKNP